MDVGGSGPRAELYLLGTPRIEHDGVPVEVDTRKAVALLAYLAIMGGRHGRDELAALLWPEYGQGRARAALRRTLSALGTARAEGWLEVDRESVGLAEGGVWVDVDRFRDLLARCRDHGHPEAEVCPACLLLLSEAVELYRGDFMVGFGLRDSFGFDDWQYFQAESLRRELAGALERLARGHGASDEWEPAIAHARRRLALDPLHEPAHRLLMQLYALSGQRGAALRQYRECVRTLKKELGVAPLEETTLLYRKIKEGIPAALPPAAEEPPPARETSTRPSENPLVGRDEEWEMLQSAYAAAPGGVLVVLEGEAGIGKTRLAEEFLVHAGKGGAATLAARCYAGETNLAYGPFVEALEAAAERPELLDRLGGAPAHALGEAVRLLPALAAHFPDLPPVPPLDTPGARSRFFEGVSRVLLAACGGAAGSPPGVLFLDDLQWADEASVDLLAYLVRRLPGRPLCVLAAWRDEQVPPGHPLREMVREAQRAGRATVVALSRLGRPAVVELVRSVVGGSEELGERMCEETEGLPLFLTEYLAAVARGELDDGGEDWSLPGGARDLLHTRLRALSETGGQVLATAAAIGRSFDFDTVREASGRGEEETVKALEELVSQKLVKEMPDEAAPVYDFSHEKLRALVYEETSLARRRLLHRRVADSLAEHARGREAGPVAARISHHYRLAGRETEAAEYSRLAADHARRLYANRDALVHYETALALGHPDPAALHEAIGDLHTLLGEYAAALEGYEAAAALSGSETSSGVEHKLGNVHARRGDWDLAESHYESVLEALEGSGATGELARLYADRSLLSHNRNDPDEAARFAHRALELAETAGDTRALAQAHNMLGVLGADEAATRHLEKSLALAEELEDPDAKVAALNNLSLARRSAGETEEAMKPAEEALALCVTLGDRHREAALHNNLADLLHAAGRQEESMQHLKRAVEIFAEIGEGEELQPEIWKLVEW
jgi:DNA-binding SARP family transcriptional activator/Tfp pilus assembly protein PilF